MIETTERKTESQAPGKEMTRGEETYVRPAVDIYEDDEGLVVLADLPGVDQDALDIRVERGVLTIQAQAKHMAKGDPIYREYQLTGYFRQFQLSEEVDVERISAELKNGVLMLRLPRSPRAQPRRIEVRASGS